MPRAREPDKPAGKHDPEQPFPRRAGRLAIALWSGLALALLLPMLLCVLLRTGVVIPSEWTFALGPVRVATTCFSRKRFCLPLENANPPPSELFVLIDWPGGERREDVLLTLPLR
jgi:hypothetical protein